MALYHLHVSAGNKSSGASGSIRHDYVTRSGEYLDRSSELVVAESGHLPSWAEDAADFWSAADEHERSNGRIYSEIEFALPVELSSEQRVALAREFAHEMTVAGRLPYTLAIHDKDGSNPHVHLLYSERETDGVERSRAQHFRRANRANPERGGAPKVVGMRGAEWVRSLRKEWEIAANGALERAQKEERIDARSYEERGLDRTPQIHLGASAAAMQRRGAESDRGALWEEREYLRTLELSLKQLEAEHRDKKQIEGWMAELEVNRARKRREDEQRRRSREKAQEARKSERQVRTNDRSQKPLSVAQKRPQADPRDVALFKRLKSEMVQGGQVEQLKQGQKVRGVVLEGELRSQAHGVAFRVIQDERNPKRFVMFPAGSRAAQQDFAQPGRRVEINRHPTQKDHHFAWRLSQDRDRGMDR